MEPSTNKSSKAMITFLSITFALSSVFYFLIIHTGKLGSGFGLYVIGLMWCPGLSALITSLVLKRKISGLAWGWGKTRFQLFKLYRSFFICLNCIYHYLVNRLGTVLQQRFCYPGFNIIWMDNPFSGTSHSF